MTGIVEVLFTIGVALGAIVVSVFYGLQSLVVSLVPRKFRRKSVEGQIVLVTGGGSGIGRLMCLKLAEKGAQIVTWDVNTAGNMETKQQVTDVGGKCYSYTVDLCDRNAVYAAADKVKREVGKVDILVNNAGIVTGKNFQDSPDELIQKTFDVNIMCHFWTTKAFMNDMLSRNHGHIVTIASLAGLMGVNKLADYCASKFAAVGFDESLRTELMVEGYTGVKTTVVCPYYISTGMFEGVKSKLIPILEPDFVASEAVDGILLNTPMVILPWYCSFLVLLKHLLPHKVLFYIGKLTGLTSTMDEFKGHTKKNN